MSNDNLTTTQTSLDTLIQNMDDMQLNRQPLEPHAMSEASDPNTLTYATMLVMLLTNQTMSEGQTRLLKLLLASMDMDTDLQPIYANIANVDKAFIQEFCEVCDSEGVAVSFLMDALTLCRLDKPLSEPQRKTLSELVNLLSLDATTLSDVLHLSNTVLGETLNIDKDTDDETIRMLSQLRLDFDYDKLKPWHEFGYRPITEESQLTDGINGGKWLIDMPLQIYLGFSIQNATVLFSQNGSVVANVLDDLDGGKKQSVKCYQSNFLKANLSISGEALTEVEVDACKMVNSAFEIEGKVLKFENSIWTADKSHSKQGYLAVRNFNELFVNDCYFANSFSTALSIENNNGEENINLDESEFINCGHGKLESGGAINFFKLKSYNIRVNKSKFIDNLSKVGSDLNFQKCDYFNAEILVNDCAFENFSNKKSKVISIQLIEIFPATIIKECKFVNTNSYITFHKLYNDYLSDEKFIHKKLFEKVVFKNSCIFTNKPEDDFTNQCTFRNDEKPDLVHIDKNDSKDTTLTSISTLMKRMF